MDTLLEKVNNMRKKWDKNKRQSKTYIPSIHDKIKFNINYYLSQVATHFDLNTALVLDSDDLGTSMILKASYFNENRIHIPNYFNKETEYSIMKKRMKNIAVFPISVDDYVDAYIKTSSTRSFRLALKEAYDNTKYLRKPRLKEPLPQRPETFDFVYLDYCGEYDTNKKTIQKLFRNNVFAKEFVFALTGSLMYVSNDELDNKLRSIKGKVERLNPKLRLDQVFVYNRKDQEGIATQTIQHRDVKQGQMYKKTRTSIKMFFMSFICTTEKNMKKYDAEFDSCKKTFCKLAISNKKCLFHKKENNVSMKPFCNNKITDFYLLASPMEKTLENATRILDYFKVPYKITNPDVFMKLNNQNQWSKGLYKTFSSNLEMLDIDKIIDSTQTKTDFIIHSVKEITYQKKKYNVSIECVVGNVVGIYFITNNDLVKNTDTACFLVTKRDFSIMLGDLSDIFAKMSVNMSKFKKDELVEAFIGGKWYDGEIDVVNGSTYEVYFESDDTWEPVKEKNIYKIWKTGDKVQAKWKGKWYDGVVEDRENKRYNIFFESDNSYDVFKRQDVRQRVPLKLKL